MLGSHKKSARVEEQKEDREGMCSVLEFDAPWNYRAETDNF